jgi:serine/threonine-protein kinase
MAGGPDDTTRAQGRARSPAQDEPPPERVGDHEVLGELGRGGFGLVLRARQAGLARDVALKVLKASSDTTELERERFRVEAQAVASLRHPGIVTVHELGAHEGRPFFSMELVEGPTLAERVAEAGPLDEREAARLVAEVARAVAHAHARGIVHGDLKPANVLLTHDGAPKVTDFGLARRLGAPRDDSGEIAGTPRWMAPEQALGHHELIGPATDVHALGALLHFLLTGAAPFEADTDAELLLQVATSPPAPVRRSRRDVSRELEAACAKAMRKDPSERYPTAADLAADLERFLDDEPVLARERSLGSLVRRWFIARPGLSVTWISLAVLYLNELAVLRWLPDPDQASFHRSVTVLVIGWAATAGLLQLWLLRSRRPAVVLAAWTLSEAALFALLLALGDGPRSALLSLQPVLILVSAFRLRPWLVGVATVANLGAWGALCLEAALLRPELASDRQLVPIHAIALVLAGLVTLLLVRRLRASYGLPPGARRRAGHHPTTRA